MGTAGAHTPAAKPIPVAVLQEKAARYWQLRTLDAQLLAQAKPTISKSGRLLPDAGNGEVAGQQAADHGLVEVTAANRQIYYRVYHVSLPPRLPGVTSIELSTTPNTCSPIPPAEKSSFRSRRP